MTLLAWRAQLPPRPDRTGAGRDRDHGEARGPDRQTTRRGTCGGSRTESRNAEHHGRPRSRCHDYAQPTFLGAKERACPRREGNWFRHRDRLRLGPSHGSIAGGHHGDGSGATRIGNSSHPGGRERRAVHFASSRGITQFGAGNYGRGLRSGSSHGCSRGRVSTSDDVRKRLRRAFGPSPRAPVHNEFYGKQGAGCGQADVERGPVFGHQRKSGHAE